MVEDDQAVQKALKRLFESAVYAVEISGDAVRGTMVENRRRYARVPLQTEVTCKVGVKVSQGRTWNLVITELRDEEILQTVDFRAR